MSIGKILGHENKSVNRNKVARLQVAYRLVIGRLIVPGLAGSIRRDISRLGSRNIRAKTRARFVGKFGDKTRRNFEPDSSPKTQAKMARLEGLSFVRGAPPPGRVWVH